ncbi:MAG TPA: glutathione peroxidase [Burkholderiales bacterium]|jgi:glutathione peroxidase|nr:glutathione peroxidase [Burkholderiales bacterium]
MGTLYDFTANAIDGRPLPLSRFRGRVVLVVNTASRCGFTPQYEGLQALHDRLHERGLDILCFPCNQFGRQEPGSAADIAGFCQRHYGVSFQMFEKVDVNGDGAHPLFRWLEDEQRGFLGTRAIKWNFTKFLVDRDGRPVARYASMTPPARLAAPIERLL